MISSLCVYSFQRKEVSGISAEQDGAGFSVRESFHILFKFKTGLYSPESGEGETGRETEGFPPETGRRGEDGE